MILMGKLSFRGNDNVMRKSIFLPNDCELRRLPGPVKRGRPRAKWFVQNFKMCRNVIGLHER